MKEHAEIHKTLKEMGKNVIDIFNLTKDNVKLPNLVLLVENIDKSLLILTVVPNTYHEYPTNYVELFCYSYFFDLDRKIIEYIYILDFYPVNEKLILKDFNIFSSTEGKSFSKEIEIIASLC